MNLIKFNKWHGTGNDFIITDNREKDNTIYSETMIKKLCNRHFGIGADGFMILDEHPEYDFEMKYYNSDGNEAEMCGNGARCMIGFAHQLGIIGNETRFMARDGFHEGSVLGTDRYRIRMIDVKELRITKDYYSLNTGVPHVVIFTSDIEKVNVREEGKLIRYSREFGPGGTNVNFVMLQDNQLFLRTYERGVEDETLSCGTGAVASAIAAYIATAKNKTGWNCLVPGGELFVQFEEKNDASFGNIFLEGPAVKVFEGIIEI